MKKKQKKILFILHIPPPVHGSTIVGGFIKDSRIINESFDCRYINLGTSSAIDEIGRWNILKPFRYIHIIWQVLIRLLTFRPELCYIGIASTAPAFYKDALIALIVRISGVKRVYHCHSKGVSTRQDKQPDDWLYRKVFVNSDVILLSKFLYPDISKYVPENRVYYCPNGIRPIQGINCNPKLNETGSGNREINILFLSNLIEAKGIFILLEACRILAERGLRFRCRFVGGEGDVSAKTFQEKVKEAGIGGMVHYAGRKLGKEKYEEFARADIFTLPSHYDTFGLVNLEAMQFCLPVVSTFEGGIPDVVEDGKTGFLVPVKNPVLLADRLEKLIKDPELRMKMGKAGNEKYKKEFTMEIFENCLQSILEKL